jgi:hypothetical protein
VLLHLVTDQAPDAEDITALIRRLALAFPGTAIELCAVGAGDTLAAGFCVADLACADAGTPRLVAHWVGEGADRPGPWPEGAGPRLCVGRSAVGTLIVGLNEGFGWSFALPELTGLCFLDVPATARDTWGGTVATAVAHARCGHPHAVAGAVPREAVPPPPEHVVARIDRHGRVKTTITALPAPAGTTVHVRIGHISATAVVSDGDVAAPDRGLVLAPATSEWPPAAGRGGRYVELRDDGGRAADRFATPRTGTPVEVTR